MDIRAHVIALNTERAKAAKALEAHVDECHNAHPGQPMSGEEKQKLESNEARVTRMADAFVAREPWEEAVARLDRLRAVTKEDVVRVARRYLGANRVVARRHNAKPVLPSIAKPEFTKVPIDPARQSAFFRDVVNAPVPAIEPKWLVAGKDYTVTEQPWGRLYAGRNPFNDLFLLSVRVRVGTDQDRRFAAVADLLGLAGAGDLAAGAFKKRLYGLGTGITVGCDERFSWFTVYGLDAHLEEAVRLLFDHLRRPHVDPDTLPKMVAVKLGAHQDNKKDPEYVSTALGEYAQRGKDSAVLRELSDAELKALDLAALKALAASLLDVAREARYVGNRPPTEIARLLDDGGGRRASPPAKAEAYLKPDRPRIL
ncbi:MAG: hypothetical protein AAB368_06310, partial [bacterium]